jgi:hypothetical protein
LAKDDTVGEYVGVLLSSSGAYLSKQQQQQQQPLT